MIGFDPCTSWQRQIIVATFKTVRCYKLRYITVQVKQQSLRVLRFKQLQTRIHSYFSQFTSRHIDHFPAWTVSKEPAFPFATYKWILKDISFRKHHQTLSVVLAGDFILLISLSQLPCCKVSAIDLNKTREEFFERREKVLSCWCEHWPSCHVQIKLKPQEWK